MSWTLFSQVVIFWVLFCIGIIAMSTSVSDDWKWKRSGR